MANLINVLELRQTISDYCDFSRPMTIQWEDSHLRGSSKHGPIVRDGSYPVGLEFGPWASNEPGYFVYFQQYASETPRQPQNTIAYFETFMPADFLDMLDAILDEAGEDAYFVRLIFAGRVQIKTMFSTREEPRIVVADSYFTSVYLSDDDCNRLIIKAPLELRTGQVDQGGHAGNFG